tara:strand:- start:2026 stop:2637 length:612 start_codon:yes stop_codon:yes gene_type:complete
MFELVEEFEKQIATFFGSPYAVAVDCCTHGIEICLRYEETEEIIVPKRTYLSVPMLANKLGIGLRWKDENWKDYYYLDDTKIIDAAVLWEKGSYIPGTHMCVSFQYRKHLNLGRGGIILTDDEEAARIMKMMSYDGRNNSSNTPWVDQDIKTYGYHYYMTPETAEKGLSKLPDAIERKPKQWKITDWPDLTNMTCFKEGKNND